MLKMLSSSPQKIANCYPPRGFKSVRGLSAVRMIEEPQFAKTNGNVRGAKRKGLLYQEQVVDRLDALCGDRWEPLAGPWFEFVDFSGHRYAQADWIGFDIRSGIIALVEIKYTRVPDAWWQMNRLYRPLLAKLFPQFKIAMLEIATNVVNVKVPEEVQIVHSLDAVKPNATSFMRMSYG